MKFYKKRIECKIFGEMLANIVLQEAESFMVLVDKIEEMKTANQEKIHNGLIALGRCCIALYLESAKLSPDYHSAITRMGINPIINPVLSKAFKMDKEEVFMKIIDFTLSKIRNDMIEADAKKSAGLNYDLDKTILAKHVTSLIFGKPVLNEKLTNLLDSYYRNIYSKIADLAKNASLKKPPSLLEQLLEKKDK